MGYVKIIIFGMCIFPFVALLFTVPFVVKQYRKCGSINNYKIIITYSMVLYLICAYFLIILPLPDFEYVKNLTTPRMQLRPFQFVIDFIKESGFNITDVKTYLSALKSTEFLQAAFNLLLTVPFGVYLRYYFKCSFKKTVLCSFLLSLFFELTQLSGLYFIYSRSYRLFDVDDLFLNTCGGAIGYGLYGLVKKVLPSQEKINELPDENVYEKLGKKRIAIFLIDLVIFGFYSSFFLITKNHLIEQVVVFIVYYVVVPIFFDGKTIGSAFFNIKFTYKKNGIVLNFVRNVFLYGTYVMVPSFVIYLINKMILNDTLEYVMLAFIDVVVMFSLAIYYISCVIGLVSKNTIFYDKWFKCEYANSSKKIKSDFVEK